MTETPDTYQELSDSAMEQSVQGTTCPETPLPADSAFVCGTLELSGTDWSFPDIKVSDKSTVTDFLVAIFTVLFIMTLNKFINLIPYIFGCLTRWKESVNVENSVQISRSRDHVALLFIIPFCMTAARYSLIPMLALGNYSPEFKLAVTMAVFVGYVMLRMTCNLAGRFIPCDQKTFKTAINTSRTFFIIGAVFTMVTAGVLAIAGVSAGTTRIVLLYEITAIYLVFIVRKSQIFANDCSLLHTILYLCTLEFLPTGILTATALFL